MAISTSKNASSSKIWSVLVPHRTEIVISTIRKTSVSRIVAIPTPPGARLPYRIRHLPPRRPTWLLLADPFRHLLPAPEDEHTVTRKSGIALFRSEMPLESVLHSDGQTPMQTSGRAHSPVSVRNRHILPRSVILSLRYVIALPVPDGICPGLFHPDQHQQLHRPVWSVQLTRLESNASRRYI